jgi:biopolymer transport protein ExbD
MKFRRRRRDEASVDLTPLIDVVFLLLIFFMVSTTFIRETQLKIDLPEASGELQEIEDDVIEITVDRRGDYAVNEQLLVNNEMETLLRALRERLADRDPSARVIITADAAAEHQHVVRAMDAAGRVGLSRISITTRQPEDEE